MGGPQNGFHWHLVDCVLLFNPYVHNIFSQFLLPWTMMITCGPVEKMVHSSGIRATLCQNLSDPTLGVSFNFGCCAHRIIQKQ